MSNREMSTYTFRFIRKSSLSVIKIHQPHENLVWPEIRFHSHWCHTSRGIKHIFTEKKIITCYVLFQKIMSSMKFATKDKMYKYMAVFNGEGLISGSGKFFHKYSYLNNQYLPHLT